MNSPLTSEAASENPYQDWGGTLAPQALFLWMVGWSKKEEAPRGEKGEEHFET